MEHMSGTLLNRLETRVKIERGFVTYRGDENAALLREAAAALAIIPPVQLLLLADWLDALDILDGNSEGDEVQQDLRKLALAVTANE